MKSSGKPCPICNSKSTISPEDDEYLRCLECGVVRTKYDYDASQYGKDYAENYLKYAQSPQNKSLNLFRLGLIARWLKPDAMVLDIGCCVGEFIRYAEPHYRCVGFEPNLVALKEAMHRTRSEIVSNLNGNHTFDCVTMFDVIEHIQEPVELLKHISSILTPGGIVAVTTPDSTCFGVSTSEYRSWKHWKPREHLFLYSITSLELLFEKVGFDVVHTGAEESFIRPGNLNEDIFTCVAQKK